MSVGVPATSANLGPGFDCLGIALDLADTLVAEVVPEGLEVRVAGEGADEVPLDERHLVARSMLATFAAMEVSPPGLHLACTNRIPHSRGLGSSSAAIVGGIVLARALVEGGAEAFDDAAALSLASLLEGHPDNVAPALLGGFVISGRNGEEVWAQQSPVDPSISAVVFVPPHGVRTDVARACCPRPFPTTTLRRTAVAQPCSSPRSPGTPSSCWRATEDFLHQQQRLPVMPESLALVAELRGRRVPAVVSGAGPTVLAFVTDDAENRGRTRSCRVAGDASGSRWPRRCRVNVTAPHDPPPGSKHRSRRTARH